MEPEGRPANGHATSSQASSQFFARQKFWVSQRTPNRSQLCKDVKRHGGTIVPLERHADILIADGARSDWPPGACSYKLIGDSVRLGLLQLPDRYFLDSDEDLNGSHGGSGHPTRRLRVAFTEEDDNRLVKFVQQHPEHKDRGRDLFIELASLCPRHPWQSWRDRWVKRLQSLPTEVLDRMAASAPDDDFDKHPVSVSSQIASGPQPSSLIESTHPETTGEEVEQIKKVPASTVGNNGYSSADDEIENADRENQDAFYEDLRHFAAEDDPAKDDLAIPTHHMVGNKRLGLYQLFEAVVQQGAALRADLSWKAVAEYESLGLDGDDPKITARLEEVWDQYLDKFQRKCADYAPEDSNEPSIDEERAGQDEDEGEMLLENDDWQPKDGGGPTCIPDTYEGPFPSSPPIPSELPPTSSKRSCPESYFNSRHKRRRLSPNAEIPSTPDETLGITRPTIVQEEEGEEDDEAEKEAQDDQPSPIRPSIEQEGVRDNEQRPEAKGKKTPVERRLFNIEVKDSQDDTQAAFTQVKTPGRSNNDFPELGSGLEAQSAEIDVTASQREENLSTIPSSSKIDTVSRLRKSPTPKEVVPRTQVSTQSRIAKSSDPATEKQAIANSASKPTRPVNPESPRHVPAAAMPPRRTLPTSFSGNKVQTRASTSNPPLRTSQTPPSTTLSPRRSTSHGPQSNDAIPELPVPASLTAASILKDWTLQNWRDHYEKSYLPGIVKTALKATTMSVGGHEELVMRSLQHESRIPSNYEGVWTQRDDQGLKIVASIEKELGEALYVTKGSKFNVKGKGTLDKRGKARKEKSRLLDKHGQHRMEQRLRYLEAEKDNVHEAGWVGNWVRSANPSTEMEY